MKSFSIQRLKSEAPLMAAFAIFAILVSLIFYPLILWFSFLVFPVMLLAYWLLRRLGLGFFGKQCFLILDEVGIRYCFHVFQQPRLLKWEQVDKVNFQMYEINFRLKESGEVISMQTAYLEHPSDTEELKAFIASKCQIM